MAFVVNADFESLLKKTSDETIVQEHEAFSLKFLIKSIKITFLIIREVK